MKKYLFIYLLSILSISAFAQGDLNDLLKGSVADANRLIEGYSSPMLKSFGYGLNQGWYNTAKPHKSFGVDLTVSVSAVYIPNSDLFYTVKNSELKNIQLESIGGTAITNGTGSVPTVFGPEIKPRYGIPSTNSSVDAPGGIDLKKSIGVQAIPIPIAHLGIGLPKGFDLKVRFVPTLNLGSDTKFNLFGVGVMHDLKQYMPGVKSLPFDLSAFVGYTKMKLDVSLDPTLHPDQKAIFESSATTIQGLISKKISVLTFYGGIGYNIANNKLAMKGNYDLDQDGKTDITDPINIKAESNGLRTTAGLRLKLAVFTFHGDYTIQKYNTLTVGFGINVR